MNCQIHGGNGTLLPEVKLPEFETNNLFPFTVEFGINVAINSFPTCLHIVQRDNFTRIKLVKISGRNGLAL